MADVIQKVISANDIVQGAAVVAADKFGNYQNVDPQITKAVNTDDVETKYTERF
jgi:hypothetical protein